MNTTFVKVARIERAGCPTRLKVIVLSALKPGYVPRNSPNIKRLLNVGEIAARDGTSLNAAAKKRTENPFACLVDCNTPVKPKGKTKWLGKVSKAS